MINAPAPAKLVDMTLVCDDLKWSHPSQCYLEILDWWFVDY